MEDAFACFISLSKFGKFNNFFETITALPQQVLLAL